MENEVKPPRKHYRMSVILVMTLGISITWGLFAIGAPFGISLTIGMLTSAVFWYGFSRLFRRSRNVRLMFPESDEALRDDLGIPQPPEPTGITKDSEDPRKFLR